MEYKDYYKILGVARGASEAEIKAAYRRLARKFHPDVSKEKDAEARFKEVNEAYEVLKDKDKRHAYDTLGANWQQGQQFRPPPGWEFHTRRGGGPGPEAAAFSDFFSSLFGEGLRGAGHGGPRGFEFHSQGFEPAEPEGADAVAEISLEEAFRGTQRSLGLREGGGTRTVRFNIAPGAQDGQRLRLRGQGGLRRDGTHGDLLVEIRHSAHGHFRSEGRDIHLDLPVAPWEAALGATVPVPTLGGTVDLKVPAGTQTGRKLRLKGRGLPGSGGASAGDQFVHFQVMLPPAESEDARRLFERMRDELPFNPRRHLGV